MIELRFWHQNDARRRYETLTAKGLSCNMSADGRGVFVRHSLKYETPVTETNQKPSYIIMT